MATLLEAAEAYIREGLHPFPVRVIPSVEDQPDFQGKRQKKPTVKWAKYRKTPPTLEQCAKWWDRPNPPGMGICTEGLCVVDVDAQPAMDALIALMDRLRIELPGTRIVQTPRGGLHVYFRASREVRNSTSKLAPGVDIRGNGGYVVVPPTEGYIYFLDEPIVQAPEELLMAVESLRSEIPQTSGTEASAKLREEFEGGDETLLGAACKVASAPIGRRNDYLNREAFAQARRDEVDREELVSIFLRAAELCGLSAGEAAATIRSAVSGADRKAPDRPFTDLGNAERLVDTHGEYLRYAPGVGWMEWRSTHWRRSEAGPIWVAGMVARELGVRGKEQGNTDMQKWARQSENERRLTSAVKLARTHPEIQIHSTDLDRDPYLLATPGGTVDLRTSKMRAADPNDLCTRVTRVAYDPDAEAPRYRQFLEEVFPDVEVREHIRRWAGYCATGLVKEQLVHLWHGEGANGKSVLLRVLSYVLGSYAQTAAPELLVEKKNSSHPTERAELRGARFVHTSETGEGRRWDMSTVKQLTGSDPVKGRFMRGDFFEFLPTWSIVVATNHRPRIVGYDHADWRRILVVPFVTTFQDDDVDLNLLDKLLDESPGILRWVVEGARDYIRSGLAIPDRIREEVQRYRSEQDVIGAFIGETTETTEGFAPRAEMWRRYKAWASETGEYCHGRQAFFRLIGDRWGPPQRQSSGDYGWPGHVILSPVRGIRAVK